MVHTSGRASAVADIDSGLASVAQGIRALQRLRGSRQVHAALTAAAGVDFSQQAVQVITAVRNGSSVAEVATEARMDMGAVSRQLKSLEDEGLLERCPSPDNGAVVLVSLTAKGRAAAARVTSVRDTHLAQALQQWTPDEVDALGELLHRLVEDLQSTPYSKQRQGIVR